MDVGCIGVTKNVLIAFILPNSMHVQKDTCSNPKYAERL